MAKDDDTSHINQKHPLVEVKMYGVTHRYSSAKIEVADGDVVVKRLIDSCALNFPPGVKLRCQFEVSSGRADSRRTHKTAGEASNLGATIRISISCGLQSSHSRSIVNLGFLAENQHGGVIVIYLINNRSADISKVNGDEAPQ